MATLSTMTSESASSSESDRATAAATLVELRRAEVLAHTRYPKLGRWYPPVAGVVAGGWIATFAASDEVAIPVRLLLTVLVTVCTVLYTRRRGATTNILVAPQPIKRATYIFFGGFAAFAAGSVAMWHVAPWWLATVVATVAATVGVAAYERMYARAARQVELDAGIADGGTAT